MSLSQYWIIFSPFFWKVYSVLIYDWLIATILDDFPTLFDTYQLDQVAQVCVQLDFETYS